MKMDEKELLQKLKLIRYHLYYAENLHDRSSLHSSIEEIDKLLKRFGIDVPVNVLPNNWLKDNENE